MLRDRLLSRFARLRPLRAVVRDREGTTAIEFAFVAVPFLMLLFGVIEIGLAFFANQVLSNATMDAARMIRTGQAHAQGFDADKFKEAMLEHLSGFPITSDRLTIDVERIDDFSSFTPKPLIKDGELVADTGYNHGEAGQIIVVRALYRWPMLSSMMKTAYGDLSSGDRLLVATAVFRNEPFPWTTQQAGK